MICFPEISLALLSHAYTEDLLVEQSAIQCFLFFDGKSSMFSHQNCLHSAYAIT